MYSSFDIAKEILSLAKKEKKPIEPMKLLKLAYIIHGWYLGFKDKPLINSKIQAWQHGPVIPELYHVIKRFGYLPVNKETIDLYSEKELNIEDKKFVEIIWNAYKNYSGLELSTKTHKKNTPWAQVYDGSHNKVINNEIIEDYYKNLIDARRKSQ